jgi:hypothetical protein
VITGTRDKNRKVIYRLVAAYKPDEVRDCDGGLLIRGRIQHTFKPPVELNDLPWFPTLLRGGHALKSFSVAR